MYQATLNVKTFRYGEPVHSMLADKKQVVIRQLQSAEAFSPSQHNSASMVSRIREIMDGIVEFLRAPTRILSLQMNPSTLVVVFAVKGARPEDLPDIKQDWKRLFTVLADSTWRIKTDRFISKDQELDFDFLEVQSSQEKAKEKEKEKQDEEEDEETNETKQMYDRLVSK
jgi:hypothetical protein